MKECGAFFIATADGDQPHVRAFGVSEIIGDRLYIMTGKAKDVYKQMAKNGKFEICALKPSGSEIARLALLHLSSPHDEGVTACIVVEPSDEETAAECLPSVARLADVEQDVGVRGEESLDEQENGLAKFLIEW